MITNPFVGMKVRCIKRIIYYSQMFNQCGVVKRIGGCGVYDLSVDFDGYPCVRMNFHELEPAVLSPEDIERQRREEHAMRFL